MYDKLEPSSQSNYNYTENSKCLINVPGEANEKVEGVTMAPGTGKVSCPPSLPLQKYLSHTFCQ